MQVDKNSWHIRFLSFVSKTDARNFQRYGTTLCEYVQALMKGVFVTIIGALVAALTAFALVIDPVVFFTVDGYEGLGGMGLLVDAFFLLLVAHYFVSEKILSAEWKEPIFVTYIKAKKNKYCPFVEIVDSTEKEHE